MYFHDDSLPFSELALNDVTSAAHDAHLMLVTCCSRVVHWRLSVCPPLSIIYSLRLSVCPFCEGDLVAAEGTKKNPE